MEEATRSGGMLVLLCALIEDFSSVNLDFGPGAIEEMALETAELLGACFRRSDFLARLGNAQFCALAVDAVEPSAPILRQRVESRLAIHNQSVQPWGPLLLRLSVGYWGANDMRSFTEFLDAVECELREPKAALKGA
jgi:GGDEF domain-containing protein